ncbi:MULTISPECIES: hypothetical protein [unclassified Adlercreutzia]|uniref:hypothetical protein n=1 Tax=unclassified Adlercreutzia TaxID=2636013 RepID=UPI0013EBC2CA|nr:MULTISPECIES: hypothetical protein [unclassified Adlercreutzia]
MFELAALIVGALVCAACLVIAVLLFRGHITLLAGIDKDDAAKMTSEERRRWSIIGGVICLAVFAFALLSVLGPLLAGK